MALGYHRAMGRTLSRDTSPEAEEVQLAILRTMPAWKKLRLVEDSCRATVALVEAGVRARHPRASEDEVRYRVRVAVLGKSLAEAAYGRPDGLS